MMCRSAIVDAECTFEIYKIVTLFKIKLRKISLESQLVSSAVVHGVEIIDLICIYIYIFFFSSKLRAEWFIPRRVILWRRRRINFRIKRRLFVKEHHEIFRSAVTAQLCLTCVRLAYQFVSWDSRIILPNLILTTVTVLHILNVLAPSTT